MTGSEIPADIGEQTVVEVDPIIVTCAVRYGLNGRRSYIVGSICDTVRSTWPRLGHQQVVIRDEVADWLNRHRSDVATEESDDIFMAWLDLWRGMRLAPTAGRQAPAGGSPNTPEGPDA